MTLKDKNSLILMKVITYLELLEIHQHILKRERKMHLQCSDNLGVHHCLCLNHVLKQNGQNY